MSQRKNVERGAALLDKKVPGWEKTVRTAMTAGYFNMERWDSCMAGTLELVRSATPDEMESAYESDDGLGLVIQLNGTSLTTVAEARRYGFFAEGCYWDELDALWREQVEKREVNGGEHDSGNETNRDPEARNA